jgi:formate hydrogenlyase subunit 3/multisubunit Na+/H+ antiporter MnhD subunit
VTLFLAALGLILGGGVAATVLRRRAHGEVIFEALALAGCVLGAGAALAALIRGGAHTLVLPSGVPGGDWVIGIDALSAVFLIPIFVVGAAAISFGTSYMAGERGHRAVWLVDLWIGLLIIALALVVTARAIVPFLIAWELMAIASYLLILTDHERPDVRRGGLIYLVTTHTATLVLFAMFGLWGAGAGDWTFASLAAARAPASAVLALAIVGFGFKAGIVPFHFWLPPAHASAPTHVSAVLSGVVIKTGIYGLLRVVTLLGAVPTWWGWLMLVLGGVSGILGVLWALAQHDLKRLLAYHSVENIGIILMGIGVGSLGAAYGHPAVAVIGYAGAILHTVNHALFKSLLFLGAGAVYRATGTRDMEQLGGLARRLPFTWVSFLIGATAIIGLPPLNGFVSEWLVYQGLFRAGQASEALRLASLGVSVLALIGALALACFAKVAGVVFLGAPRTPGAEALPESDRGLRAPMLSLAAACVALGVFAPLGMRPAIRAAVFVSGVSAMADAGVAEVTASGTWIGGIAAFLFATIGVGWLVRRAVLRRRAVRFDETWACGYVEPTARMQYTASSFAAPLLSAFGRASGTVAHRTADSFATHPLDLVLDRVAMPAWAAIQRAGSRLRPLQRGRLSAYLIYVMAALVVLLVYLAIGSRP